MFQKMLTDGNIIPAGTTIVIFIYGVHHDSRFYSNPDEWNPQNFDSDRVTNRHSYSFIPFGIGPRMCVGKMPYSYIILLRLNLYLEFAAHDPIQI